MNEFCYRKCMSCVIHQSGNIHDWENTLSTVELVTNTLPNKRIGFSPFYLNYRYEPILPIHLIRGNEKIKKESISSFEQRVTSDWESAKENL